MNNELVKNFKLNLEDEMNFSQLNIEFLKENENEELQVDEFNKVLIDIGDFMTRQLTRLRLQEIYDEDVIRREEDRIDLEQNKIG